MVFKGERSSPSVGMTIIMIGVREELEGDQYHILVSRISKVYDLGSRTWSRNATSLIHPLTHSSCGCHGRRNVTYDPRSP